MLRAEKRTQATSWGIYFLLKHPFLLRGPAAQGGKNVWRERLFVLQALQVSQPTLSWPVLAEFFLCDFQIRPCEPGLWNFEELQFLSQPQGDAVTLNTATHYLENKFCGSLRVNLQFWKTPRKPKVLIIIYVLLSLPDSSFCRVLDSVPSETGMTTPIFLWP